MKLNGNSDVAIPDALVPKDYHFDPRTEIILPSSKLKPGMILVASNRRERGNPELLPFLNANGQRRLRSTAGWSRIISMGRDYRHLTFVSQSADGTKLGHNAYDRMRWIVKKASIPK